ncbi:MAG: hypothetical protein D6698_00170, partial [Gammaproteobacteria bacterium]
IGLAFFAGLDAQLGVQTGIVELAGIVIDPAVHSKRTGRCTFSLFRHAANVWTCAEVLPKKS